MRQIDVTILVNGWVAQERPRPYGYFYLAWDDECNYYYSNPGRSRHAMYRAYFAVLSVRDTLGIDSPLVMPPLNWFIIEEQRTQIMTVRYRTRW